MKDPMKTITLLVTLCAINIFVNNIVMAIACLVTLVAVIKGENIYGTERP